MKRPALRKPTYQEYTTYTNNLIDDGFKARLYSNGCRFEIRIKDISQEKIQEIEQNAENIFGCTYWNIITH